MPSPHNGETQTKFISRCMSNEEAKRSFPDQKQRVAFCHSKWKNKSRSGSVFVYEDPKTGELFHYSRKGVYRKNGRVLVLKKQGRGEIMSDHILNRVAKSYADEKAGYPPNCNEGYVEKDGKCVPVESEGIYHKDKKDKKDKKKTSKDNHNEEKKEN